MGKQDLLARDSLKLIVGQFTRSYEWEFRSSTMLWDCRKETFKRWEGLDWVAFYPWEGQHWVCPMLISTRVIEMILISSFIKWALPERGERTAGHSTRESLALAYNYAANLFLGPSVERFTKMSRYETSYPDEIQARG